MFYTGCRANGAKRIPNPYAVGSIPTQPATCRLGW